MGPGPETVLILLIVHLTGKLDFALQFATLGNAVSKGGSRAGEAICSSLRRRQA
jgi:hypothetical protein